MTTTSKQFMSAFALSAAALFLGGCKEKPTPINPEEPSGSGSSTTNVTADEQVKCFGINDCSGQSVCAVNKPELGIEHACAGENDCKGKGWIKVSRSECEGQSGEVLGTL
jgi:hypothetical protein